MPNHEPQSSLVPENSGIVPIAFGRTASEWFRLGCAAMRNSQLRTATQMFEYALIVDPSYTRASNRCGKTYLEQELNTDAQRLFEHTLQYDPANEYALLMLGCMRAESRDYDAARNYFERVVRMNSESYIGWKNLATTYDRLGCLTRATLAHSERLRLQQSPPAIVREHTNPSIA